MKITKKYIFKTLLVMCSAALISACSIPGMRMASPSDFTPSVNQNDKAQQAPVIQIDTKLILTQRLENKKAELNAAKNYIPPEFFTSSTLGYEYTIGYQDVLNVVVWDYSSLTNTSSNMVGSVGTKPNGFTVDAKGEIYYPYVGYVKVFGLTVAAARDLISTKLSKYLKDPQLTLQIISFNSQRINVMGAVTTPIMIPVSNIPTTVLDAINAAGGPIRCGNTLGSSGSGSSSGGNQGLCADTQNIIVKKDGIETIVNLDTLKSPNGSSTNWVLSEGSTVFIPGNKYIVALLGDVVAPGALNMINGKMTLSQSIVAAQGVTVGSAPAYTYIIRGYNSDPKVYTINLKSPDAFLLAGQFELKPQDIIFVSPSGLETVGEVLGYIAPITSLAISTAALAVSLGSI